MKSFLPKSEFSKNVATMLTGNMLAQFIPLLITPVLSRLFSVEEFGVFALYSSIAMFVIVIASGRYEMAILLPKEDKQAVNVLALCFFILTIISGVFLLVTLFFGSVFVIFIDKPELKGWIYLLPLTVFFGTSYRILSYWSNRKKRFKDTSISSISQALSRSVINLGGGISKIETRGFSFNFFGGIKKLFATDYIMPVGISKIGLGSLIYGYIIGFGIGAAKMAVALFRKDRHLFKEISFFEMKNQARIHDKFPKINALHAMVDELKNSGVAFIIAYLFSDIILGLYAMTFRVLTLPLSVIGNAFGQVFLQKSAEMHAHHQRLDALMIATLKKLFLIAIPIFLPILFFGPQLFSFVLGNDYELSGVYAQLLTPWLLLNFVMSPILQIPVILGKQKELFQVAIVGNLIIFGSIFIGGYFFENLKIGFIILSSLEILYYFWLYRWVMKLAKNVIN